MLEQRLRNLVISGRRFVYVTYDITADMLRTSIAHELISLGLQRLQYSVFRGFVPRQSLQQFRTWAASLDLDDDDSIHIVDLCDKCMGQIIIIGQEPAITPQHLIF